MAVCDLCGFDGLQDGKACGVCGGNAAEGPETEEAKTVLAETLVRDPEERGPRATQQDIFRNRYRIEAKLGSGGMGSVSLVTDLDTGDARALKILHQPPHGAGNAAERFRREAGILRRIDHPLIPRIHEAGIHHDQMYLVTDYVEGESLRHAIWRRGRFPADEVVRIASVIAEGLDVAHHLGVIHRDIKPDNVMLTTGDEVRLLDFGIAREVGLGANSITGSGILVGTPEYMSPEQFLGDRVDARSDIYSLGVLMFELVTGQIPFTADTPVAMGLMHTQEAPPSPRMIQSDVPVWLNRIILKCLEKEKENRYPTTGDLASDLTRTREKRQPYRRLRSGDFIVDDEEIASDWALVLASKDDKSWPYGSTLLLDGTYYRLEMSEYEAAAVAPYLYKFRFWPEGEAIRKMLDFDPDRPSEKKAGISASVRKWFSR